MLLNIFEDVYLKGLKNRHTGYATVTTLELLHHLYNRYGVIIPNDIDDNDKRMKEPYDVTKPIETLYDQIEKAVEYADAGKAPYNTMKILAHAYLLLNNTGHYMAICKYWRRRPEVEIPGPNLNWSSPKNIGTYLPIAPSKIPTIKSTP